MGYKARVLKLGQLAGVASTPAKDVSDVNMHGAQLHISAPPGSSFTCQLESSGDGGATWVIARALAGTNLNGITFANNSVRLIGGQHLLMRLTATAFSSGPIDAWIIE